MRSPTPHKDLRNSEYLKWSRFLESSEGWSRDEIQDYQLSELRKAIAHATRRTSGYRRVYSQRDLNAESLTQPEDMLLFPLIEKETIRDSLESFSAELSDREYVTTGGSTGVPLGLYRDPKSFARELASKAHQYKRLSWKEGDPQLVLRAVAIETSDHMQYEPEFNELRCSSFHLSPEAMEMYRKAALSFEPKWIKCLPSSGLIFARYLLDTGLEFPKVQGILCSSENLSENQRAIMHRAFGGRVFSHYGHYEMSALAGYCEYEDTYHVLPQYGYVELIRDGKPVTEPGEMGEIVATSFISRATPFIRYRTKDLAIFAGQGCKACGRPYQIWSRIVGRFQEFLLTRSGRYISVNAMNVHDEFYDYIREFQFAQMRRGEVIFRFVPKEGLEEASLNKMKQTLTEKVAGDAEIVMARVDHITPTSRGKRNLLDQHLTLLPPWEGQDAN